MSWILTASGVKFDLRNPRSADVRIGDIAHALARICRFTGHTRAFYSVAQHSVGVANLLPRHLARIGLLHDATEAYVGDMSSPLKELLPEYQAIEHEVWRAIAIHFGMREKLPPAVKRADLEMLAAERRALLPEDNIEWVCLRGIITPTVNLVPWDPETACRRFIEEYQRLTDGRGDAAQDIENRQQEINGHHDEKTPQEAPP